jgi:hypothetical protein
MGCCPRFVGLKSCLPAAVKYVLAAPAETDGDATLQTAAPSTCVDRQAKTAASNMIHYFLDHKIDRELKDG